MYQEAGSETTRREPRFVRDTKCLAGTTWAAWPASSGREELSGAPSTLCVRGAKPVAVITPPRHVSEWCFTLQREFQIRR